MTASNPDNSSTVTLEETGDGVAWIIFDNHEIRPNILTRATMTRLSSLLDEVMSGASSGRVRALVIRSGKDGSFIAGADITEFSGISSAAEGEAGARAGQMLYLR